MGGVSLLRTQDPAIDPLEPDERSRAVAAVHHQVFDMPLARDVTGERFL
jgi:hypothetical protein